MKKLNQNGFVHLAVSLIAISIVIGIIGISAIKVIDEKSKNQVFQVRGILCPMKRVTGDVVYFEQGPTDAVTGSRKASATIAIGSPKELTEWKVSSDKANKNNEYHLGLLEEANKPTGVKIIQTNEGYMDITLMGDRKVMCLLGTEIDATKISRKYFNVYDCQKFIKNGEVTASIGLIGFGSNRIECSENVCEYFDLKNN